ncbi:MAG: ribbon-helix-helix protein, CopG family [Methylococcales bacterium]|nr:ribbon-helix-helix protein, CopG family [Methylococcales bacterium]
MRTTITIDDSLYLELKQLAAETHKTFTKVVEDALRNSLEMKKSKNKNTISLLTAGEGGLVHGIDLDDSASLNDIME